MCIYKEVLVNYEKPIKIKQLKKPKLSRKIVSTAKTNLNRYWNKFEKLFYSDNNTTLNNALIQKENLLNNYQDQMVNKAMDEVTEYLSKTYSNEKNIILNGQYKQFNDDSLYQDVDISGGGVDGLHHTCPCDCHKPLQKNRYSLCVMEGLQETMLQRTLFLGSTYISDW